VQDVHIIDQADQANELLKPIRIEILSKLGKPTSCPEIAKALGLTTQKVNYHMKVLVDAGLVELVDERRVRGIMEGVYLAVAKSFWFSPRLVSYLGNRERSTDQASLAYLLQLAEDLQVEIGQLVDRADGQSIPSLGVNAQIQLRDGTDRARFLAEVKDFFTQLADKYGEQEADHSRSNGLFRLMLACYQDPTEMSQQDNTKY
jgi:DNA-binding transcriptional ArsR family regulator